MAKKTQVYNYHQKHGHIVEYAGYDLPVWYEGITAECKNVRDHAGIFDVSHMGRILVEGPDSAKFLDSVTTNNVSLLGVNKGHYSLLCNPVGGIIDDLTVFRLSEHSYLVVYNAANREKNWNWLVKNKLGNNVKLNDVSDNVAMFAVQGPAAAGLLKTVSGLDLENIDRYATMTTSIDGNKCLVTRTGYTGEDGFEVYVYDTTANQPSRAMSIWEKFIVRGRSVGLSPVGLGARDVLRLEAGMCLYGNDIDEKTNPVEARLMFVTRLEKPSFIGRESIARAKEKGPGRVRVGFRVKGRGIPRKDQPIVNGRDIVGQVSSGTLSPTLGVSVGMGYVKPEVSSPALELQVRIRDHDVPIDIVRLPFYQRKTKNTVNVYGNEISLADFRRQFGTRETMVPSI